MPCYSPLLGYQCANGEICFVERSRYDIVRELSLPCGQCIGWRLERSRQWAMRCMHEAALYQRNCFVTLTYDDAHLPEGGKLAYPHFQRFLRRLRKHFAPTKVRFYMCGEYGGQLGRPHFHACLFGVDFDDKYYWRTSQAGSECYRSDALDRLWSRGYAELGQVTFESAAYIARYCVQKITGRDAKSHYGDLPPEFNHMSLKPGIGAGFFEKYQSDIYPHDYVVINGMEVKPPKYYNTLYKRQGAFAQQLYQDEIQYKRECAGRARWEDNTAERLAVKAEVAAARTQFLIRSIE